MTVVVEYLEWARFSVLLGKSSWGVLGGVCVWIDRKSTQTPSSWAAKVVNKFWLSGCLIKGVAGNTYISGFGF